jgi:uncharacterized protein (DUF1684 family)
LVWLLNTLGSDYLEKAKMKILITAVKRQPKITLRNKTILKENNFNFGSIIYFESWAERLASKRYASCHETSKQ